MTTLWTIGTGTRSIEDFLDLLAENRIETLADIRSFPTSRFEWFKKENLKASLKSAGIRYVHIRELGGYRRGGYLSHTRTGEFARGLEKLIALSSARRTAFMCAETVFFRCHRRYVADQLVRRWHPVLHIMAPGKIKTHTLLDGMGMPRDCGERIVD